MRKILSVMSSEEENINMDWKAEKVQFHMKKIEFWSGTKKTM